MLSIPITATVTVVSALILLAQTCSIILHRIKHSIVLGDNDDRTIMKRIRGHGNMVEQAPIFLILLLVTETYLAHPTIFLACLAALFIAGRCMHALYFLDIGLHFTWRRYGMLATLISQLVLALSALVALVF